MSSPGADDVCPICLCALDDSFSRPENCQHRFDLDCLTEWSKLRLSCPSCRAAFCAVYTYKLVEGKPILHKVQKMEPPKEEEPFDEANPLDFTFCEICSGGMHEELLLICDQCDKGFHTYCLTPPLDSVPTSEQWFCPQCEQARMAQPSTSHRVAASARSIRLVQRTALAERVRRVLARSRRIQEPSPTTSEEQNDSDNVGGEGSGSEREEEESSSSSEEEEEEEENQFRHDDERVLGDVYDLPCDDAPLPVVQRRRKKKQKKGGKMGSKTRKKKTGGTARSGRVKRRASKSRSRTKHSSQAKSEEGQWILLCFDEENARSNRSPFTARCRTGACGERRRPGHRKLSSLRSADFTPKRRSNVSFRNYGCCT